MLDELFADLLKKHTINEIYKMDLLEMLRLLNLDRQKKQPKKSESFFDLL